VINQHIAIGRACDRYDDGRNHENEFGAFIARWASLGVRIEFGGKEWFDDPGMMSFCPV
jgi:hypothetical protein